MLRNQLHDEVNKLAPELTRLADQIFDTPELGNEEFQARDWLAGFLRQHGYVVREGVANLPTAFEAVWGTGKPVIGLLCEYDALVDMGHGCAHHLQGPAIVGAAAALRACLPEEAATIRVYGTPAEETASGKLPMAKAGLFDGLDAALMMHGGDRTTADSKSLAMNHMDFVFKGVSAHAAVAPEKGINALSGVLMLFNGLGFLREHIRSDARLHGIITDGGKAANIVPERAAARFYVRAADRTYLDTLVEKVINVAKGAALATGTTLEVRELKAYDNKINAQALNDLLLHEAAQAGAANLAPPRESTGSTDFSCVTHRIPGACLRTAFVPLGTPSHSQVWVEEGKSPAAHEALLAAARTLASTTARLACEPVLLQAVARDFAAAQQALAASA